MEKKAGRPKVAKDKALGVFIAARFTAEEAKKIDDTIKRSGQTKSAWVRKILLSAANQ